MISTTDPSFLLIYGLNESGFTAVRTNAGSLGSAQDLSTYQSSGTDGVVTANDGHGGKAAWFDVVYPAPYNLMTGAFRALRAAAATGSAHTCKPAIPLASANDDFAFGARFKWIAGETDGAGGNEEQFIFGVAASGAVLFLWSIAIIPDTNLNPAAGARLVIRVGNAHETITGGNWTATGSPASYYVLPDVFYRVSVRVYNVDATHFGVKVYLYNESTLVTYTWTYVAPGFTSSSDYSASALADTTMRVQVGYDLGTGSNPKVLYGLVDDAWLYDSPMSDADASGIVSGGFTIPWTAPTYRRAAHDVYAACTREGAAYPVSRAVGVGALTPQTLPSILCQRMRGLVEGWRAGRPWLLRAATYLFDTHGPFASKTGYKATYADIARGVKRSGGILPKGTFEDARDVELTKEGPRRRRGYRVRRDVSSESTVGANAFWFFRRIDDSLYGLYKVGSALLAETGSSAVSIDTGWDIFQLPVAAKMDNQLVIVSAARQRKWNGSNSTTQPLGVAAPPVPTAALAAGSLSGTYFYAVTEYDPTTGDESAPSLLVSAISPAAQGVTLTLGTVSSDTRFSQRRIYRTTNGGAAPNLFLIATIATATTYTDSAGVDGTDPVDQVLDADGNLIAYLTGTPPDTFSIVCAHKGSLFYAGGATYGNRIYPCEPLETQRWSGQYLSTDGNVVRALLSYGHRLVAFTDSTVEIFESDWIRREDGTWDYQHTTVSRACGAVGPSAVLNAEGTAYWMDRRGIWTFDGSGTPTQISHDIEDLFPYLNHGMTSRVVASYNHLRRQLWFSVPVADTTFQTDNSRMRTVFVANISKPTEWTFYHLEASYHGAFDDDLNGLQFGVIDHLGVFKQAETYEGDGCQGNESYTTEDEGGTSGSVGIASIVGQVVTVSGTPGWTTNALRGFMVVLRDLSTGIRYRHLISANTASTFTVVSVPNAALAARDGWYLGAIDAWVKFAEQDFESPNRKIITAAQFELADLTGTLYS